MLGPPKSGKIGCYLRHQTICPQSCCLLARVSRKHSLCRKPEHLVSLSAFGWWVRSSWKQQSLPHCLVPAKKAVACQNFLGAFFASQILPLPLAGTTRTPPLILGQQNSALPTHCFEPALSECIMMGER